MICEHCDHPIYPAIKENIGRGWLHHDPSQDSKHEAEPTQKTPAEAEALKGEAS